MGKYWLETSWNLKHPRWPVWVVFHDFSQCASLAASMVLWEELKALLLPNRHLRRWETKELRKIAGRVVGKGKANNGHNGHEMLRPNRSLPRQVSSLPSRPNNPRSCLSSSRNPWTAYHSYSQFRFEAFPSLFRPGLLSPVQWPQIHPNTSLLQQAIHYLGEAPSLTWSKPWDHMESSKLLDCWDALKSSSTSFGVSMKKQVTKASAQIRSETERQTSRVAIMKRVRFRQKVRFTKTESGWKQ